MISLIVATDKNFGIGLQNKIPWKIPEELKFFKEQTIGHDVVMGSNTFQSIGKILPDRRNHVITKDPSKFSFFNSSVGKTLFFHDSVESVLNYIDDFVVIGGSSIYKQFLETGKVSKIILSTVECDCICDSFFDNPFDDSSTGNWIFSKILKSTKEFTAKEFLNINRIDVL